MPQPASPSRLAVGTMSGTSIDGLDAALVRLDGRGPDITAGLVRHESTPLGKLAVRFRAAAAQRPMTAGEFARLAWDFGHLHIELIERLLDGAQPDLIAVHGQTVFHQPPISWQLINPAPIEHRFGCPVIADLRQADLAAGGQGAPITPLADWIMFRPPPDGQARAIVNLGGYCNITFLPCAATGDGSPAKDARAALDLIRGFDVCPCNHILDAIARRALGCPFDKDGRHARRGVAHDEYAMALSCLFEDLRDENRSLGTGDEALDWVDAALGLMSGRNTAASACAAIAGAITDAVEEFGRGHYALGQVILAGGGARNAALVEAIRSRAVQPVSLSNDHGVPVDAREAMAMAVLGALRIDGVDITLPRVTGRDDSARGGSASRLTAHRASSAR